MNDKYLGFVVGYVGYSWKCEGVLGSMFIFFVVFYLGLFFDSYEFIL